MVDLASECQVGRAEAVESESETRVKIDACHRSRGVEAASVNATTSNFCAWEVENERHCQNVEPHPSEAENESRKMQIGLAFVAASEILSPRRLSYHPSSAALVTA